MICHRCLPRLNRSFLPRHELTFRNYGVTIQTLHHSKVNPMPVANKKSKSLFPSVDQIPPEVRVSTESYEMCPG